jgi:hypothetical protein
VAESEVEGSVSKSNLKMLRFTIVRFMNTDRRRENWRGQGDMSPIVDRTP